MSQINDPAVLSRLLPCPFCGAAATAWLDDDGDYEHGDVVVCCPDQACEAQVWGKDADDAIVRWNRRAPLTVASVPPCWEETDRQSATTLTVSHTGRWPLMWTDMNGRVHVGDKVITP